MNLVELAEAKIRNYGEYVYAVFEGRVSSDSALICRIVLQVMEPEEEVLPVPEPGGP